MNISSSAKFTFSLKPLTLLKTLGVQPMKPPMAKGISRESAISSPILTIVVMALSAARSLSGEDQEVKISEGFL